MAGETGFYRGASPLSDKITAPGDAVDAKQLIDYAYKGAYQFGTAPNGKVYLRATTKVYTTATNFRWRYGFYTETLRRNDLAIQLTKVTSAPIMSFPGSLYDEAWKLAALPGVPESDMLMSFVVSVQNRGTILQNGVSIKYRIVATGVPVNRNAPNGPTFNFTSVWAYQPFADVQVAAGTSKNLELKILHPAFDERLVYQNRQHIVQAKGIRIEFELNPHGTSDQVPSNNRAQWNASKVTDTEIAQLWINTYQRILNPLGLLMPDVGIWPLRDVSLTLIRDYLASSGAIASMPRAVKFPIRS